MTEAIAPTDDWLMNGHRGPFERGAEAYAAAGWTGIIPVQKSTKLPDMKGVTGRDGAQTTAAQYTSQAWYRYKDHNIGIRVPLGLIGLDVDQYDGKHGAEQMHELEQVHGELPKTWSSTARGKGPSRIMFFQVPVDCGELKGNASPDTEVIQHHHRYAIVWPSVHVKTSGEYTWFTPEGEVSGRVPSPDEIPFLPDRWLMFLSKPQRQTGPGAGLDVETFVETYTAEGDPQLVDRLRDRFEARDGCRHDTMLKALGWATRAAVQGKVNAEGVIGLLEEDWEAATGGGREQEFWGMVRAAVEEAPEPEEDDPNDFGLPDASVPETAEPSQDTPAEEKPKPSWMTPEIERLWKKPNVREEAKKQYERAQAKTVVTAILASQTAVELPEAVSLTDLLARPDAPTQWRIAGILPAGGRAVFAAARKSGKTTTVVNLVRSLADAVVPEQDPFASLHNSDNPFAGLQFGFLGSAKVYDVPGRIAVVDNEMSENQLQRWYRDAGVKHPERVDLYALRGKAASFNILEPGVRAVWAKQLQGVSFLVLDCLAPFLGALGLGESNEDVSKFLAAVDALLEEAGIPDCVLVHHMGHGDERSRGASRLRDWPDVEWKLVRERDANDVEIDNGARFFSAYGRDVDVRETQLTFDSLTRRLSLGSQNRKQYRISKGEQPVIEYIKVHPGAVQAEIVNALRQDGHAKGMLETTVKFLRDAHKVHTVPAPRNALRHFICENVECSDPRNCAMGAEEDERPTVSQSVPQDAQE